MSSSDGNIAMVLNGIMGRHSAKSTPENVGSVAGKLWSHETTTMNSDNDESLKKTAADVENQTNAAITTGMMDESSIVSEDGSRSPSITTEEKISGAAPGEQSSISTESEDESNTITKDESNAITKDESNAIGVVEDSFMNNNEHTVKMDISVDNRQQTLTSTKGKKTPTFGFLEDIINDLQLIQANSRQDQHACIKCRKQYIKPEKVLMHFRYKHTPAPTVLYMKKRDFNLQRRLARRSSTVSRSATLTEECAFCQKWYANQTALTLHQIRFHGAECPPELRRHLCPHCNMPRIKNRAEHLARCRLKQDSAGSSQFNETSDTNLPRPFAHHSVPNYECQVCSSAFNGLDDMTEHAKAEHEGAGVPKFTCDICEVVLYKKRSFWKHIRDNCERNRTWCDKCAKFIPKHWWVTHARGHTAKGRLWQCKFCLPNKLIVHSSPAGAQRHKQKFHPNASVCSKCGYRSRGKSDLRLHMLKHIGADDTNETKAGVEMKIAV